MDELLAQISAHIDTDPRTWNKDTGVIQYDGQEVAYMKDADVVYVFAAGVMYETPRP